MSGSINKVLIVGNVARDVEVKSLQNGDKVVNVVVATSESWKDKQTGERKERSEFNRIVCFNQGLASIWEQYVKKGDKVYVEGQLETRSYENKDGQKVYTTEIVQRQFRGGLQLLSSKQSAQDTGDREPGNAPRATGTGTVASHSNRPNGRGNYQDRRTREPVFA